ncbi:MAG: hypothetical protein FWD25_11545 [Clostridia bacterium]|nr:hypothetical protein [Clostridia bacterium]
MEVDEHDEYSYERTQALVDILHAHSNLGVELLSKRPNSIPSEDKAMWGWDYYPHSSYYAGEYRWTGVHWRTAEAYHVFGIYIGESLEKARDTMAQYGYVINPIPFRREKRILEQFAAGKIIVRFTANETDTLINHIQIIIHEVDMPEHNAELYAQTQAVVDILHAHSNLGMELLSKSRIPESEIIEYIPGQLHEGWPPEVSRSANGEVRGYYFRYPYYAREYRLINVEWSRGETHHVFGIHIGDSLEKARDAMAQYGYSPYESPYCLSLARGILAEQFINGKVIITFEANEADLEIRRISIHFDEGDPNIPENVRY